uniref:NOP2/Sun RNA methyltransferase 3 n=1 Tax=Scleropages formosus TaxID=113540 RepID=A0A8C9W8P9_SCLFO
MDGNNFRICVSLCPTYVPTYDSIHELSEFIQVCVPVLEHFDTHYGEQLGQRWTAAREVLLHPRSWQHGVMLNRFAAPQDVREQLLLQGFSNLLPRSSGSSLQCFVHRSPVHVPSQRHQAGQLKQYYLLNAASLLPVLALDVREGDRVLDLCSAPGGKALAILQSATPGVLHCNELDAHRHEWLVKTLESFVPQTLSDVLKVSNLDGRLFGKIEAGAYDKVLLDAPCSNDRSWLFSGRPQHGALWLRERAKLPELQKDLLRSALEAVVPGGLVVYSTCTLSRAENSEVVQDILSSCPNIELQELNELALSFAHHFTFDPNTPFGLLVVPDYGRTWGPMFVSKLKKLC